MSTGQAPAGEARELDQPASGPALDAPDASFTRARWIPQRTRDWVYDANRIMLEHGAVKGRAIMTKRYQARWRSQRLINLMVELKLHERHELREHTEQASGGWAWYVEYLGG